MRLTWLVALCLAVPVSRTAWGDAVFSPAKPARFRIPIAEAERARMRADRERYPHLMSYLASLDLTRHWVPVDPRNAGLIPTSHVYVPTLGDWKAFWLAAAADHLTCLKAFALLSRRIKEEGVVVFGPGSTFEKSVAEDHVDLGLALPAHNIGMAVWSPDPSNSDPEFELHIKVFYTKSYTHRFPDAVLPADLKIGYGPASDYWMDGEEFHQPTIDADIYDGPIHGIGFRNVKGVGGHKRGFMGFIQTVLFFLPDAIDSMTIDEGKNELVTEALVNTVVKDFETKPIYSIKAAPEN